MVNIINIESKSCLTERVTINSSWDCSTDLKASRTIRNKVKLNKAQIGKKASTNAGKCNKNFVSAKTNLMQEESELEIIRQNIKHSMLFVPRGVNEPNSS